MPPAWRSSRSEGQASGASYAIRPPASTARTRPGSSVPSSGVFLPREARASAVTVQRVRAVERRRGRPARPRRARPSPLGATGRRARPPGRSSAPRSPARAAAARRRPRRAGRPSAVSMPLIPFAARPNSTSLSTSVCGAWSVAIASAVPSTSAARQAAASSGDRSGGFTRSDVSNGAATIAPSDHGIAARRPRPSGARRRSTRRSARGGAA